MAPLNPLHPNEAIRGLAALIGDEATREIVQVFLEDFPESLRKISQSGHDDQLRIAHGLKTSAFHMGADALSGLMVSIEERLSRQGEATVSAAELDTARAQFESFAGTLRAYAKG
jgi:HPt (histidine-containing phosphotransfer) domain-containing protein